MLIEGAAVVGDQMLNPVLRRKARPINSMTLIQLQIFLYCLLFGYEAGETFRQVPEQLERV